MIKTTFKIGRRDPARALANLDKSTDEVAPEALVDAGKILLSALKSRLPKRTGRAAAALAVKVGKLRRGGFFAVVGVPRSDPASRYVEIVAGDKFRAAWLASRDRAISKVLGLIRARIKRELK